MIQTSLSSLSCLAKQRILYRGLLFSLVAKLLWIEFAPIKREAVRSDGMENGSKTKGMDGAIASQRLEPVKKESAQAT